MVNVVNMDFGLKKWDKIVSYTWELIVKDFVLLNNNFSSFFYLCNPLNPADVKDECLEVQHDREVP